MVAFDSLILLVSRLLDLFLGIGYKKAGSVLVYRHRLIIYHRHCHNLCSVLLMDVVLKFIAK